MCNSCGITAVIRHTQGYLDLSQSEIDILNHLNETYPQDKWEEIALNGDAPQRLYNFYKDGYITGVTPRDLDFKGCYFCRLDRSADTSAHTPRRLYPFRLPQLQKPTMWQHLLVCDECLSWLAHLLEIDDETNLCMSQCGACEKYHLVEPETVIEREEDLTPPEKSAFLCDDCILQSSFFEETSSDETGSFYTVRTECMACREQEVLDITRITDYDKFTINYSCNPVIVCSTCKTTHDHKDEVESELEEYLSNKEEYDAKIMDLFSNGDSITDDLVDEAHARFNSIKKLKRIFIDFEGFTIEPFTYNEGAHVFCSYRITDEHGTIMYNRSNEYDDCIFSVHAWQKIIDEGFDKIREIKEQIAQYELHF